MYNHGRNMGGNLINNWSTLNSCNRFSHYCASLAEREGYTCRKKSEDGWFASFSKLLIGYTGKAWSTHCTMGRSGRTGIVPRCPTYWTSL